MFFKRLVDFKNHKVKFRILPKTNDEYTSVTYGCIRFNESYRFLSSSFDKIVKYLDNDDCLIFKIEFPDKWQHLKKNGISF